ncbi:hypothetical protein [Mumia zhuanghuii]|uniref:Luciferase-like domain-containing protein n=1 Tax=Mumia zhuanghuii TaxID=2585211 RepID=A0A5C4MC28_9ACTN|nr:hypothetical protein FHE65_27135 [Mumia zhuanghuii]
MEVSLHLPRFDVAGGAAAIAPVYAEVATIADEGGLRSLSVMDHYFQMEHYAGGAPDPMLEAYTGSWRRTPNASGSRCSSPGSRTAIRVCSRRSSQRWTS